MAKKLKKDLANLRKKFLQMSKDDIQRLREINEISKQFIDTIVEDLYEHLLEFPQARRFLEGKGILERVKSSQKQYFLDLTRGKYDDQYVQNRRLVGIVHERIGLGVDWYLGAYRRYLDTTFQYLHSALQTSTEDLWQYYSSLLKIIFFDMILAIETYIEKREETISIQEKKLMEVIASLERRNEELAETNRKLEIQTGQMLEKFSLLNSLGVISSGVTHEINQPLNAIKLTADGILFWSKRHEEVLPQTFLDKVAKISQGAAQISEIIQHMRSFWTSSGELCEQIIDVAHTIHRALALIERQLYAHGIKPQLQMPQKILHIRATPTCLEQIVINLIANAMHSVDAARRKKKTIIIALEQREQQACIEIIDNGVGLPEEIALEQLFDPFYSTKKQEKGMGLGLALVKRFVDSLAGEIQAANNSLGGATFTVSLPICDG